MNTTCNHCGGKGYTGASCRNCNGAGTIQQHFAYNIQLMSGTIGFRNVMVGDGDADKNKRPGDYVFEIIPRNHPHFLIDTANNHDLVYNVDVPISAAVRGFKLEIPPLDSTNGNGKTQQRIVDIPGDKDLKLGMVRLIQIPNFTAIGGLTVNAKVVA